MFTGIIENLGKVLRRNEKNKQIRLRIDFGRKIALKNGESIAVNGVCLTVSEKGNSWFEADVVRETLRATTLGQLQAGDPVHLERSLRHGQRVGGHYLSGHVEGVGKLIKIETPSTNKKGQLWTIKAPSSIMRFLVPKGSIAVDGVSLTLQDLAKNTFKIALIPHTLRQTTFGNRRISSRVNLETDILAKLARQSKKEPPKSLRVDRLIRQGF